MCDKKNTVYTLSIIFYATLLNCGFTAKKRMNISKHLQSHDSLQFALNFCMNITVMAIEVSRKVLTKVLWIRNITWILSLSLQYQVQLNMLYSEFVLFYIYCKIARSHLLDIT